MPRGYPARYASQLRPNVPMSVQVANHLRVRLRTEFAAGGRLPSENKMAAELAVSRGTVRQALAILQHEALISKRQGLGTFANPHVLGIPARIDFAYEFSELIDAAGYRSEVQTLEKSTATASAETASKLDIEPGAPLLRLRKLYLASGQPAIYEEDLLATDLVPEDYDPTELEQPIWHFLERRCRRQLKYVLSEIIASLAQGELAGLLKVAAGSPILKFVEVLYDNLNAPLVLAQIYFRADLIRFHALRKVSSIA